MSQRAKTLQEFLTSSATAVADLPVADFVERWRLITGEPPAILLSSRTEMLALLIKSVPVPPFEPPVPTWGGSTLSTGTTR